MASDSGMGQQSQSARTCKRGRTRPASSLTPAELACKRASDREAQRGLRTRKREQMEELQLAVQILEESAKSLHQRVKMILQKNQDLEEELRKSLNREQILLSPISGPWAQDVNQYFGAASIGTDLDRGPMWLDIPTSSVKFDER